MRPEEPGPIQDASLRRDLKNQFGAVIEGGISNLEKALAIDPRYEDAMAYMNLLIRERADLLDSKEEYVREISAADDWVMQALKTKKEKAQAGTGVGARGPSTPAPPPP